MKWFWRKEKPSTEPKSHPYRDGEIAALKDRLKFMEECVILAEKNQLQNLDTIETQRETIHSLRTMNNDLCDAEERAKHAIDFAVKYGGIDGAHHKTWVIDQMVRLLTASEYETIVAAAKAGEDGPETYSWDEGIAP